MDPQKELTWKSALTKLKEGNARFTSGQSSVEPLASKQKLEELATKGQKPYAIILSCADSRVPVERIFDEGVGDLFVIRVAGNIVQSSQIASIEYAVANLGVSLLAIVGHSKCGAVQAAVDCEETQTTLDSGNLNELVDLIRPAVKSCKGTSAGGELLADAIRENVRLTRELILEKSPLLRGFEQKSELGLVEGYFDMQSGVVNFKEPT